MMAPGSSLATPSRAGGKAAKRSQFGRSAHSILKIAGSSSVPWCRRRSDPARCAWLCSGRWTTRRLPRPSSRVAPRCGPAAFPAACLYLWEPPAGSFGSSAPCPLEEKTGPPKTPETNWDGMGGRKAAHGPLPRVPSACLAEAPPLQSKGAGRAELPCELGDHSRLRRSLGAIHTPRRRRMKRAGLEAAGVAKGSGGGSLCARFLGEVAPGSRVRKTRALGRGTSRRDRRDATARLGGAIAAGLGEVLRPFRAVPARARAEAPRPGRRTATP